MQQLNDIFKKTALATNNDAEVQAHWAKYLCVLCAGLLENALVEIYKEYVDRSASPAVSQYATHSLERISNPKTEKFIATARAFKERWGDDLKEFSRDKGRGEAVDSIMSNRHLIAHGKDSQISLARLKGYYTLALELIEYVESQCLNL